MDEFIHYHNLLCAYYPLNKLNEFREACNAYHLDLLSTGVTLPLRTYMYSGSLPSLYYAPLFFLWKSPESARFLGYLFVLFQAVLLHKLFRFPLPLLLGGLLLFFPYSVQHLVDTGPVGLHATSVFLLYLMLELWMRKGKAWYPLLMGLLVFLCIWTKSFYLVLLPGLGILFAIRVLENRWRFSSIATVRRFALQGTAGVMLLVSLVAALYLSTEPGRPGRYPFLEEIRKSPKQSITETFVNLADAKTMTMVTNPLNAAHRVFHVEKIEPLSHLFSITIYLVVPCILLLAVVYSRKILWRSGLLYLAFLGTFFAISMTPRADSMHHVVLTFPFLILSSLTLLRELPVRLPRLHIHSWFKLRTVGLTGWIALFIVFNSVFFLHLPSQTVAARNDASLHDVHTVLRFEKLSQQYLYVVLDWGAYYRLGLYGNRDQGVLYTQNLYDRGTMERLHEIRHDANRKLAFVYNQKERSSDIDTLTKKFALQRCGLIEADAVWQVLLEEGCDGLID